MRPYNFWSEDTTHIAAIWAAILGASVVARIQAKKPAAAAVRDEKTAFCVGRGGPGGAQSGESARSIGTSFTTLSLPRLRCAGRPGFVERRSRPGIGPCGDPCSGTGGRIDAAQWDRFAFERPRARGGACAIATGLLAVAAGVRDVVSAEVRG